MSILQTENLTKIYGDGENAVHALRGINLTVEKGEFTAIVGTSGSGKSTLLHMLGGLDRPTTGKVMVDGKDIFSLSEEQLTIFRRRKIGFVFQSYNLVPVLNLYENIVLPLELDGKKIDREYIDQIAETLGLKDRLEALRISFPVASSSVLRLQGHSQAHRRLFSPTSQPVIWIPKQARTF